MTRPYVGGQRSPRYPADVRRGGACLAPTVVTGARMVFQNQSAVEAAYFEVAEPMLEYAEWFGPSYALTR